MTNDDPIEVHSSTSRKDRQGSEILRPREAFQFFKVCFVNSPEIIDAHHPPAAMALIEQALINLPRNKENRILLMAGYRFQLVRTLPKNIEGAVAKLGQGRKAQPQDIS
ncbi:hypothetical protein, partial [Corynebacterium glutamicum]|uniref:hypothetical protein n=1 Tax=Corynebacterium glutamicum TaxID=1718 RepID=UPI001C4F8568